MLVVTVLFIDGSEVKFCMCILTGMSNIKIKENKMIDKLVVNLLHVSVFLGHLQGGIQQRKYIMACYVIDVQSYSKNTEY